MFAIVCCVVMMSRPTVVEFVVSVVLALAASKALIWWADRR
jgi:hypothetical protein